MPANKNAVTRYKYLDELLSDEYHYYDIHDLTDKCNDKLLRDGFEPVSQRCIEKDLKYLEYAPFSVDLDRFRHNGKSVIRYKRSGFSIFTKELSEDEENLLSEVLSTIGQFEGLANFRWLDRLKRYLGVRDKSIIIDFGSSAIGNSRILGELFSAISNKQVVEIEYHTFNSDKRKFIVIHPYILKQYNNRWFLICAADSDGFILTFALDRIDKINHLKAVSYRECPVDFTERFKNIVGVTMMKGEVEEIIMWVSEKDAQYLSSKPIHQSQKEIIGKEKNRLFQSMSLNSGRLFKLNCVINHELKQQIGSYLNGIVVLSPSTLREEMKQRFLELTEKYSY